MGAGGGGPAYPPAKAAVVNRASFVSVKHLSDRIRAFIKYFNKTMAKPFKWTYRGRPLTI